MFHKTYKYNQKAAASEGTHGIYYIVVPQLAAAFGGCIQLILKSPLHLDHMTKWLCILYVL